MLDYDTFLSIYVTPNRHPDTPEYDAAFIQDVLDELSRSGSQPLNKLSLDIILRHPSQSIRLMQENQR